MVFWAYVRTVRSLEMGTELLRSVCDTDIWYGTVPCYYVLVVLINMPRNVPYVVEKVMLKYC